MSVSESFLTDVLEQLDQVPVEKVTRPEHAADRHALPGGPRGSRGRGRGLRAERTVLEVAKSDLACARGIQRGPQAQEVVPDVVVVAGYFHSAVVLHPVLAVHAVVNRHDVAVVAESDVQRPIDLARLVKIPVPHTRVRYELEVRGPTTLADVLAPILSVATVERSC